MSIFELVSFHTQLSYYYNCCTTGKLVFLSIWTAAYLKISKHNKQATHFVVEGNTHTQCCDHADFAAHVGGVKYWCKYGEGRLILKYKWDTVHVMYVVGRLIF